MTPRAIPAPGQARAGLKSKTALKARLPIVCNRAAVLEPFHLTLDPRVRSILISLIVAAFPNSLVSGCREFE